MCWLRTLVYVKITFMNIEYEIKFPKINIKEITQKILDLNAVKVMDRFLYKRYISDLNDHSFIRLRTTPDGASITIKESVGDWAGHLLEQEMFIKDFEEGKLFVDWFIKNNLIKDPNLRYQENYRTMYKLGKIEFCIDEWPLIHPFLEIEAPNEKLIKEVVEKLGLNWDKGMKGSVNNLALKLYKIDLASYKLLTFDKQEKV